MGNKQQIDPNDIDQIEFELIRDKKLKAGNDRNYVNNRELFEEYERYHEKKLAALEAGKPIPPLTDKIGRAIIQIATRRCDSHMYRGYTNNWKEEMIGNAICVASCNGHNFDPTRYNNPFAYLTQICDNAIREQLNLEKRELYIRNKSYVDSHGFLADMTDTNVDDGDVLSSDETNDIYAERVNQVHQYEERMKERQQKHAERRRKAALENQLDFGDQETEDENHQ